MIQIVFHELAEKELYDSRDFYDDLVFGLGSKFVSEIEYVINRIRENPYSFPLCFSNFRKALLRKFPYGIIFQDDGSKVFILAIAHQSRKPKYYANRLIK